MREPALPCPPNTFIEPAARPDRRRAVPVRPRHVRLDVRIDPATQKVHGTVTHQVDVLVDLDRVTLDAADLHAESALVGGDKADFIHHAGGLDLILPQSATAGQTLEITITYRATPTLGLYFQPMIGDRPAQVWSQGAMEDHHHWFPCFDAPEHMVTTEVIATVPGRYTAISNGVLVDAVDVNDGWRRFHWRHSTPHALYLLTLFIDEVVEVKDTHEGVSLHHYVPPGREDDAKILFERTGQMLDVFARLTGTPYPYPRYGHVFLRDFMWGGMENTTLTSLTDRVLVEGRHRHEEDVERLIAHELAHQWFGDLIAPRGWHELWLNESFASYFELLCMQALEGGDDFDRRLVAERDSYLGEAKSRYMRPIVTRNYAHPYVLFDRHAYEKGCLVLHMLRDQLGNAIFWRGLRLYVQRNAGRAAETVAVRRAFEDVSGRDLSAFFEGWIYGAGHPVVHVEWRYDPLFGLEVTLRRTDQTNQTLVATLAWHRDGETHRQRVPIGVGDRTLILPADGAPQWLALDPNSACLIEVIERSETETALCARLTLDTPRMLRVRTIRLLAQRATAQVTDQLINSLQADQSATVRMEAAKALGAHRCASARVALAEAVEHDPDWHVQAAAGTAMGVGAKAADVPTFERLLETCERHRVRCGLLAGLGALNDPAAHPMLQIALMIDSPRHRVAAAAIAALAKQDEPGLIELVIAHTEDGHAPAVRKAALAGLPAFAMLEATSAVQKKDIRERLEAALLDPTFGVRYAAVGALKKLADPKSKAALKRAHGAEAFGIIRRVHREALGALKEL